MEVEEVLAAAELAAAAGLEAAAAADEEATELVEADADEALLVPFEVLTPET